MPATSTTTNPRGISISFEEATHKYWSTIDGKELKYISGTSFLGKFYPEFDPDGKILESCASKKGISPHELKAQWEEKGKESCRLGTRMHECIEDTLLRRSLRNSPENIEEKHRFNNGIIMANKIYERCNILGVEKIVFSDRLGIAGTIDLFCQSRKDNTYLIIDHKSNKKIETFNTFNKFCLFPIEHLPDLNYYHYALQLSLYEYLLKYEGYVPKKAVFRRFLNHVTPKQAKLIELPDYSREIRDMLIEWLRI